MCLAIPGRIVASIAPPASSPSSRSAASGGRSTPRASSTPTTRSSAASATGTVHDDSDHLIAGQADVHGDCGTEIVVLASGCARDGPPLR